MRPRHIGFAVIGTLAVVVLRLNAADPPPGDLTCRGAREDQHTIDCKRGWIFDHCTTFAIEHEATFEAINECTLEANLLKDYCAATPPWCVSTRA